MYPQLRVLDGTKCFAKLKSTIVDLTFYRSHNVPLDSMNAAGRGMRIIGDNTLTTQGMSFYAGVGLQAPGY